MSVQLGPDGAGVVADAAEAASVYAKGFFGTPSADGSLGLDRYETVYLAEMDQRLVHGHVVDDTHRGLGIGATHPPQGGKDL